MLHSSKAVHKRTERLLCRGALGGHPHTQGFARWFGRSEGTEYVYEVFDTFVVGPTEVEVTEPMEGRNILTLQTCTLPDYSERIITQAELVETNPT